MVKNLRVNPERLHHRLIQLARIGETPDGGVNRVAFTNKDIQGGKIVKEGIRALSGDPDKIDNAFEDFLPAATDPGICRTISQAAGELGLTSLVMPNGAGHDAQKMASIARIGMIFIPSIVGISHSPEEFSREDDIANGVNVLLQTILKIDGGA